LVISETISENVTQEFFAFGHNQEAVQILENEGISAKRRLKMINLRSVLVMTSNVSYKTRISEIYLILKKSLAWYRNNAIQNTLE